MNPVITYRNIPLIFRPAVGARKISKWSNNSEYPSWRTALISTSLYIHIIYTYIWVILCVKAYYNRGNERIHI